MISGPDGSMYVGSGNEGQIYRIDASGKGSVFFDAEELEVHALALVPGGGLMRGHISGREDLQDRRRGQVFHVLFDPPDKSSGVWRSTRRATSSPQPVTKASSTRSRRTEREPSSIKRRRRTRFRWRSKATAICSSAQSHLGRLFRLDANGKPFVLLDSPHNEIHTLKLDPKGVIYAAAFSGPGGGMPQAPPPGTPTPRRR